MSAGMSLVRRVSSSGFRRLLMFGTVRHKYVHLLERPWVRAEYTACGWVFAIVVRLHRLDCQELTIDSI